MVVRSFAAAARHEVPRPPIDDERAGEQVFDGEFAGRRAKRVLVKIIGE